MLEFLKGVEVENVFTFSVPPEGEDYDFSQRLTETKTFGGSVFDKYGNDTIKINLSGTTGNEDKKIIYRGFIKPPLYLNGEKEIWELQKVIEEWHDLSSDTDGTEKTIYLYDLSKTNIVDFMAISAGKTPATRNYWQVFIKDLKIKRSSSKPNYYNYSLEMFALVKEKTKQNGWLSSISDAASSFTKAMNVVEGVMGYTELAVATVQSCTSAVAKVKKAFEAFQKMGVSGQILSVMGAADGATRILTGGSNNTFYNAAKDCMAIADQCKGIFRADYQDNSQRSKSQDTSYFTVSFDANGGSNVNSQKIEYSKTAKTPAEPAKSKYSFDGWYTDEQLTTAFDFNTPITADITLYAKWVQTVATVTFNSKNGSRVASQEVTIGEEAAVPAAPTRSGYIFKEWCTDYAATQSYDFETPVTGDMTLYAAWTTVAVVTFNANGGSEVESQTVKINGKAVYPITPTRENYTFSCWCSDSDLTTVFDFNTSITADIALYAKWVQISNTVTFRSNGGSSVASQDVMIGSYATEPEAPTKEGFNFVYWCDDVDCTNEFHFNTTPVTGSLTLYAKWSAKEITVTFDSNGGSEVEPQVIGYGDRAVFPEIPVKENAVFVMWEKAEEVDSGEKDENERPIMTTVYSEFDFADELTEDITLYAKWFGA